MSLSHQSAFTSPAAGATVPAYYGSYNQYSDFYGTDHLDFTHHQTASHHQHGPYASFPAASYGMLSALQGGGAAAGAGLWYDHSGVESIDTAGFSRFDVAGSTAAFRRLPVSAPTLDVKPETVMRMSESRTGRSAGRTACRELNSDVDVSFSTCVRYNTYTKNLKCSQLRTNWPSKAVGTAENQAKNSEWKD